MFCAIEELNSAITIFCVSPAKMKSLALAIPQKRENSEVGDKKHYVCARNKSTGRSIAIMCA